MLVDKRHSPFDVFKRSFMPQTQSASVTGSSLTLAWCVTALRASEWWLMKKPFMR